MVHHPHADGKSEAEEAIASIFLSSLPCFLYEQTIAPNMITLLGLFGPMIAVLNLIIHDTSMSILLPWWTGISLQQQGTHLLQQQGTHLLLKRGPYRCSGKVTSTTVARYTPAAAARYTPAAAARYISLQRRGTCPRPHRRWSNC
mgnify:CR=1 FL=1